MPFVDLDGHVPESDLEALVAIATRAATPGMLALELGSWCGRSSSAIASVVKETGGTLYCIDRWDVYPDDTNCTGTLSQIALVHDVLSVFRANMKMLGFHDVVVPMVGEITRATRLIADNCADLIFIDADHRYSCVKQDILNYWPKLKIGGVLCGRDYDKVQEIDAGDLVAQSEVDSFNGIHCGVIRAVDELFGDTRDWDGTSTVWSLIKTGAELPAYGRTRLNHNVEQ